MPCWCRASCSTNTGGADGLKVVSSIPEWLREQRDTHSHNSYLSESSCRACGALFVDGTMCRAPSTAPNSLAGWWRGCEVNEKTCNCQFTRSCTASLSCSTCQVSQRREISLSCERHLHLCKSSLVYAPFFMVTIQPNLRIKAGRLDVFSLPLNPHK